MQSLKRWSLFIGIYSPSIIASYFIKEISMFHFVLIFGLCSSVARSVEIPSSKKFSSDESFDLMKEAYYDEDWQSCVDHGLASGSMFKLYLQQLLSCRRSCGNYSPHSQHDVADSLLESYGASLKQITCIGLCKPKSPNYFLNLMQREPYDYIQICYYKLKNFARGAAAATTFLVANPKHNYMQTNLRNYKHHLDVREEEFVDLEAPEFEGLYKQAVDAYEKELFSEQLDYVSRALDNYHHAYNNCSLLCEEGYNTISSPHDTNHEVVGAIADQLEQAVRCKAGCRSKLSKLDLIQIDDILRNMYHHLQYAHTQVGNYRKGAEYAAAFLLHEPENKGIIKNKEYMKNEKNVPEEWFQAPAREVAYKLRIDQLEETIKFLDTEYISQHSEGKPSTDKNRQLEEFLGGAVKINQTSEMLGGAERFVADGFATRDQCNLLINMCKEFGVAGAGYAKENPHTRHESFHAVSIPSAHQRSGKAGYTMGGSSVSLTEHEAVYGLRINETQLLVDEGKLSPALLNLYLELSEKARGYTELYFNQHKLYFDFTHLVCRTAIDSDVVRDDLSHLVHSDNCNLQDDGTCHKAPPAYTQRDYSGILYLNDDFEGGDFFFADNLKHEVASVRPKCGRLVAFNSADYHGVKAVTSGRRCAIAVWFTLDPAHVEISREEAWARLRNTHGFKLKDEL